MAQPNEFLFWQASIQIYAKHRDSIHISSANSQNISSICCITWLSPHNRASPPKVFSPISSVAGIAPRSTDPLQLNGGASLREVSCLFSLVVEHRANYTIQIDRTPSYGSLRGSKHPVKQSLPPSLPPALCTSASTPRVCSSQGRYLGW